MKFAHLSILMAALVGCTLESTTPPETMSDAGPEITSDSGAEAMADAGSEVTPDAGAVDEREIMVSHDGELLVVETTPSDEVRELFPTAVAYYLELDGDETIRIHLVDAAGNVMRLDVQPAEVGNASIHVSFPIGVPTNCFAPPCPWETPSTTPPGDGFSLVRRGDDLLIDGGVGSTDVGTRATIQEDGTLMDVRRTATVPADEMDVATMEATMVVIRDLRDILGSGPFDPGGETEGAGCTIGKALGWALAGGLVAACCVGSAGAACVGCGALGGANAGLIGEVC